jgi:hypothetical protein
VRFALALIIVGRGPQAASRSPPPTAPTSSHTGIRCGADMKGPGKSWDVTGIVIYLGNDVLSFGDRIFGIPLSVFWVFRR